MWPAEHENMEVPVIEKIDDPEKLLAEITECLQQKDTRSLKTHILEHKTKDESIFWELILRIGRCINAETFEHHPEFFDVGCRCLMYLVKVGNPKETLLALLEQVDTFIDDVKFQNFLPPIQTALLKIPTKLFHSLDITLETVSSHLRSLELPENTQLEGDEVTIFHADKIVIRLADILYVYLKFLEPFVNAVVVHLEMTAAAKQEALVLRKHLIRLFEHPLCHLVLTYDPSSNKAKSDSRICAELAVSLLSKVQKDFHKLMKHTRMKNKAECAVQKANYRHSKDKKSLGQEECENQENEMQLASSSLPKDTVTDIVDAWDFHMEIGPLAKACLAYLIHVEHLGLLKYPAVYTHGYLLDFYLEVVSVLLKNTNYPVNYKGLLLLKALTDLVPKNSIAVDYLDNPNYLTVINDLIHIMIKCPVRDHRTTATTLFPEFIGRFVAAGRFQLYQSILISCDHSGLKGYLITLLKNDIHDNLRKAGMSQRASEEGDELRSQDVSSTVSEHFMGKRLEKLLKLAITLPEKETTDMLENSDQIISSLNLLRFMVLADPPDSNITGFWNILPDVERDFLSPLRRGLDLSRAHYVLELESMKAGRKSSGKGAEIDVSIEGLTLPMVEEKEKVELLGKAVNTHDVIMSLVARVSELVDQQRRIAK